MLLVVLLSCSGYTQECDTIFNFGEQMPQYEGGKKALDRFHFHTLFPIVGEAKTPVTKLHYQLTISKQGKVNEANILTKMDKALKLKLQKELLSMPDWIPGLVSQKAACIRVKILISCIYWE